MKALIKSILPPIVYDGIKGLKSKPYGWKGDYNTWEEARKDSIGYNQEEIFERVRQASIKVRDDENLFERDGVLFDTPQYSWPLLSSLLLCSSKAQGSINVLDFGGSLGSSYFQNKRFLDELNHVSWNVVEQDKFVSIGKQEFQNNVLKFYYSVDEVTQNKKLDVLLLGSVLQYIENPYELLSELVGYGFKHIIIDRTPFVLEGKQRITKQIVPPDIYDASYPCHLFNKEKILLFFKEREYSLIEEFSPTNETIPGLVLKGFLFKSKKNDV